MGSNKRPPDSELQAALEAVARTGSKLGAARELGLSQSTFRNRYDMAIRAGMSSALSKLEVAQGWSPEHDMIHVVPSPMVLRGTSTLYGKEGELKLQWVKTKLSDVQFDAAVKEWIAGLSKTVAGLSPLVAAPEYSDQDLLCVYPLGDPHFGMYAWMKESGDDFDLEIARKLTLGAVDRLLASSPNAATAIILPLGDFFHSDDQTNVTPGHKNQLDVDTRHVKVLGVGIETFRHVILRALEKHAKVIVRFVAGNHDPHSIWALAFTIQAYFSNDPRVEVDLSPSYFWFYKFGNVLIGATHGDKTKGQDLLGVMACDQAEDWGKTKHRYWYTGHIHSQTVRELPGVTLESFRTLAAKDAYAAGQGYRAGRDMRLIVHHREHGEIERHRCDVGMLR